ncbi:MAG TPA: EamA family transporter [Candidatus Limnocylindria bacterium]
MPSPGHPGRDGGRTARYCPAIRIYAAFLGCCLVWGSTFLAIRLGNESIAPVWGAAIRLVLAAVLLTAIARVLRMPLPRGAALRGAALYGFFNFGVNFSLLYLGEQAVPSGIAAVLFATVPLSTALLAAILGVERLVIRKLVAALVAILGVAVIFAGELGAAVPLVGLLTVFSGATAAALSGVLLKQAPRQPAIPANAIGAAVGAAVCLVVSFVLGEAHAVPATLGGWLPLLYLVVAGSLGAFVLFSWLIARWPVTNASLIGVIVPIIAVTLGAIVKAEAPAPLTYVGAAIVIAAVLVAIRAPHRSPESAPALAA